MKNFVVSLEEYKTKVFEDQQSDDEDANIIYFFSRNRYRSITTGEFKKRNGDYITLLSGRTEIERWDGACTNTFKEAEKLKKILDNVNWWDKTISNTSPEDYKKLMKSIMTERHKHDIKDIKLK